MRTIDKAAAGRAVDFIEKRLKHTKGRWAGIPFKLAKWQRDDIIRPIFGTLDADGKRQIRTAYVEVPRKNGKSELAAAIGLKLLFADSEQGAEIYLAACDRDQASIVFNVAAEMVRRSPALALRSKIIESTKRILFPKMGSFLRAIPADVAGSYGYNAHAIIADELHAWPKRDLWDALTTSTGAREQPLVLAITTAGYDRASICWEQHEYARQVIEGTIKDPTFFAYIRAAPADADWHNERVWKRSNPALGDFRSVQEIRSLAKRARHTPALQNTFRRLYLNQWTQQVNRWLDLDLWAENAGIIDEEALRGQPCFGGLDLGANDDLTAWVLAFPDPSDPELVGFLPRFWCPEEKLTDSSNLYAAQYAEWKRLGFLKTTPGATTDWAFVREQILRDAEKFELVDLAVDRWQAHQITTELEAEGLIVAGMGQGFADMACPTKEFERRLFARKVRHGGNPILTWMAAGVAVRTDPAANLKVDKAATNQKVDGIVAAIMALNRLMLHEENVPQVIAVGQ